jgi:hypothetical protein
MWLSQLHCTFPASPVLQLQAKEGLDSAAALPVALWAKVLQIVPQQQRPSQCPLVCRIYAVAAAQATVHLVLELKNPDEDAVQALQRWLALHEGQLRTINIRAQRPDPQAMPQLQLPLDKLAQLQILQLKGFKLQLLGDKGSHCSSPVAENRESSTDGGSSSHAATLSSLQHLELKEIELATISSLLQITNAPQLRSLIMTDIALTQPSFRSGRWNEGSVAAMQEVADAMPGLLQQLPKLSVLKLPYFPLTDAVVQQAGPLQGLQWISLAHTEWQPLCNLQVLPSSITRIELQGDCRSCSLPAELTQLSGLLQLELESCAVHPRVLSCCTQLRVLHMMDNCRLLPGVEGDEQATEGTAALLDALLQLTQLQDLKLQLFAWDILSTPPQCFAALTASSQLTQLEVTRDHDTNLPMGAIQHMFPAGRQMQSLQRLGIDSIASIDRSWCITKADLRRISQCCPQLQWLDICGSVQPGADLSVLLELPDSCTSLLVGGAAFDDAAVPAVLLLTQLKHLSWSWSNGFTDAGLEQLVGLDLDSFYLLNCDLSKELHPDESEDEPVELRSRPVRVSAGHASCWQCEKWHVVTGYCSDLSLQVVLVYLTCEVTQQHALA